MARTRYQFGEAEYPYFMTCTVVGWLPVFSRPEFVDQVLDSWRYLQRERSFKLFGYVIIENQLHLIASAPSLPETMKSFKSFTARTIIDRLKELGANDLLRQLQSHKRRHKVDSTYQLWQEGSHPQ